MDNTTGINFVSGNHEYNPYKKKS